jgi:hypothetical protein
MADPELEVYEMKLREVFDPSSLEFNAILVRLSVLFEDLRIEESGSRLEKMEEIDVLGKSYRQIYFLRRSIASLVEFAGAAEMLDQRPEFRKVKKKADAETAERWDAALKYFKEWKEYLKARRGDFGAHFDHAPTMHAIKEMNPGTVGQLVVVKHVEEQKGGVRLKYAHEIVAAAMTHRKPDAQSEREWFHDMFIVVRAGMQEAVKAIHSLSIMYLLEKFGRERA